MVENNNKPPKPVPKSIKDLSVTNEEFFKQNSCMYFTDTVTERKVDQVKFVNEFAFQELIGRGSYSKVKRVIRQDT